MTVIAAPKTLGPVKIASAWPTAPSTRSVPALTPTISVSHCSTTQTSRDDHVLSLHHCLTGIDFAAGSCVHSLTNNSTRLAFSFSIPRILRHLWQETSLERLCDQVTQQLHIKKISVFLPEHFDLITHPQNALNTLYSSRFGYFRKHNLSIYHTGRLPTILE